MNTIPHHTKWLENHAVEGARTAVMQIARGIPGTEEHARNAKALAETQSEACLRSGETWASGIYAQAALRIGTELEGRERSYRLQLESRTAWVQKILESSSWGDHTVLEERPGYGKREA